VRYKQLQARNQATPISLSKAAPSPAAERGSAPKAPTLGSPAQRELPIMLLVILDYRTAYISEEEHKMCDTQRRCCTLHP
jgi:hypothetical protein